MNLWMFPLQTPWFCRLMSTTANSNNVVMASDRRDYWREYSRRRYATDPEFAERKRAALEKWRRENPEKHRANWARYSEKYQGHLAATHRERYAADREARIAKTRAWQEANPEKYAAQKALNRAIRRGELARKPCEVCGNVRVDAHHDDYSHPLNVRWLCRRHHVQHHKSGRAF